jgi:acyl-CoA reductase-like NAD-dependent aldehyde dehydrogenase
MLTCSVNTHHRNDPSSPWGGTGSSGVGSENGIRESTSRSPRKETDSNDAGAYHAYSRAKSTIINYASAEEARASEDWFREGAGEVRYG